MVKEKDEGKVTPKLPEDKSEVSGSEGASQEGLGGFGGGAERNMIAGGFMGRFRTNKDGYTGAILDMDVVPKCAAKELLGYSSEFEELFVEMVAEIAHLRVQLDATKKIREEAPRRTAGAALAGAATIPATQAPALPMSKPVETWSVVVKGKTPTTSKEVIKKVVKGVGPSMGVRVREMRPLKDEGAIIRTPSVAERDNLAKNAKFSEVGLDVSVRRKLGPRFVVQGVHTEISPAEFMGSFSV